MEELVYKDMQGNNPRKHEVSIEEISDSIPSEYGASIAGKVSKKRICKYFVKERFSSKDVTVLKEWVRTKRRTGSRKDCHVIREVDTKTGANKIVCKVLGNIYVICGSTAYNIVYMNEIKIQTFGIKKDERGIK